MNMFFLKLLFIASLLLCGTTVMNAQTLGNILQKYKALDHKYRNDENVGMTCQELKTKYLKELRQFDEQINTLLGESQMSMALDTLKESKVLIYFKTMREHLRRKYINVILMTNYNVKLL